METNPFELGTHDLNIANALDYYKEKIESRHKKELQDLENKSLLKYYEEKNKRNKGKLNTNQAILDYQNHLSI